MKRAVISYIKKQKINFIMYVMIVGIFCLVLYLYDALTEAIWYAAVLSLFLLLCVWFGGLVRYIQHFRELEYVMRCLPAELGEFPKPDDGVEQLYQEGTKKVYECKRETESEMGIRKKETVDYYSLWVHQIKTPISALYLLLQSWEEEKLSDTDAADHDSEREMLGKMRQELFKTEQYAEMVLTYLRTQNMTSDLSLQWYPIDNLVRQAVRKYSQMFIISKIRLDYQKTDNMVLTDEKWLVFVIEQLLSNALKYTKKGTISIYMEQDPGTDSNSTNGGILVIEDTGIGIQAEDLPRIFEKGFTGYNGRRDKKSTGIGLYLCKTICGKLNHEITAESQPGKGTKMKLRLSRREILMG